MGFPSPSEKQAKVLWFSLTALAIAIFLALLTLMFYGVAWLLDRLTPVLLPLAVAGIFAFLLNPLVDYFEKKMSPDVGLLFKRLTNPKRVKAIIVVFLLGVGLITSFTVLTVVTVVPKRDAKEVLRFGVVLMPHRSTRYVSAPALCASSEAWRGGRIGFV